MRKFPIKKRIIVRIPRYQPLHVMSVVALVGGFLIGEGGFVLSAFLIGLAIGTEVRKTAGKINQPPSYDVPYDSDEDKVQTF